MEDSLTILFQGPVLYENEETYHCITSARKIFPKSNIILSTWNDHKKFIDEKFYKIKNLEIVYSEDPGAPFCKPNSPLNVNRIIVSSKNGLEKVKTKYVFKCRSDIYFQSKNVINLYCKYKNTIESNLNIVSEKVLFSNQTSLNPKRIPILYHLCDWIVAGNLKDVKKIFDIDLMPNEDFHWFLYNKKPEDYITPGNLSRYMSEDYIVYKFCKKNLSNCIHDHYLDTNDNEQKLWLQIIADNFIIMPNKLIGIKSLKYHNVASFHLYKSFTFYEWQKLSKLNNSIILSLLDQIKIISYKLLADLYKILFIIKNNFYNKTRK